MVACEVQKTCHVIFEEKIPKIFFKSFEETMSDWQKSEVG